MSDDDEFDYYAALGVKSTATSKEIRKAYRQLSRTCHPDRNDAPDARAMFERITKARDVLSDDVKKAKFDARLQRKAKQRMKDEALDAKTRKMKQDLVDAERAFVKRKADEAMRARGKAYHLNKLRQESLDRLEQDLRAQQLEDEQRTAAHSMDKGNTAVCVKWKREKPGKRPGYSERQLEEVLRASVGHAVASVNVVGKRKRQAIVHFANVHGALTAVEQSGKIGHPANALVITWLAGLEGEKDAAAAPTNAAREGAPSDVDGASARAVHAYDGAHIHHGGGAQSDAGGSGADGLDALEEDVFAMLEQAAANQKKATSHHDAKHHECPPKNKKQRL